MRKKIWLFCGMDKQIPINQQRREAIRKYSKTGAILLGVAVAIFVGSRFFESSVRADGVTFSPVTVGELETTVAASGHVVPEREEIINAPVATRILEVFVQPGDTVQAGMPLIALDLEQETTALSKMEDQLQMSRRQAHQQQLADNTSLSELEMQIAVKEMEVKGLRLDADNERRLDSLGSGTGERVRQAETAYSTGLLQLKQLRQRLANERLQAEASGAISGLSVLAIQKDLDLLKRTLQRGRIPAPHDGVVTYLLSEIGSQVSAGQKVAVVADLSSFKIEGEVAEGSGDKIGIGATADVRIGNESLEGVVSNITPQSKGGMMQFAVKLADASHKRLRSGLRVEMQVNYGYKDSVMRIERGNFFKGPGEYQLFVASGNNPDHLERRTVKLGDSNRRYVEVLSGLNPGERVAVSDMSAYEKRKSLKLK